jgi:outer membrane protein OmpA-like peptidoglycan-associated protein/tetratricopeptide (TPR) repeat protein
MKKIICIYIVLFGLIAGVSAQNIEFTKSNFPNKKKELKAALKDIKEGDELFIQGRGMYLEAIEYYFKAYEFNPNNAEINYKIGTCYLFTIDKTKAVGFFEKALELNPMVAPDAVYLLAQAYHITHEFDKAIDKYEAYKHSLSPKELREKQEEIDKKIEECNYGKELIANPSRAFIDNVGSVINTQYDEYSPIINADETMMIFTSRRNTTTGEGRDPRDKAFFEDVYISYKDNTNWQKPTNPGSPINTKTHDATVGLSADGQKLFIYRGDNGGDLYECELKGDSWTKPKRLDKTINTKYHESSATFSYDGKTIYFVSDKEGGFGGRDIYMSRLDEKGRWGEAQNLGSIINTKYDEEGVFMHPDGKTLYFSSKGHNSMGGYDIFKTVYENGTWSKPENIGYPINTAGDDVFFSVSASGIHGYYSSAKPGGKGKQDVYIVTFLGPEKPLVNNTEENLLACIAKPTSDNVMQTVEVVTASLTLLKGKVLDQITLEPVEAQIVLTDNELNEELAVFTSNSATGRYMVSLPSGKNYGIAVKAPGYLFHSENFNVPEKAQYQEIEKDVYLKKVEVGSKIVLKNIFFDFGKATLRSDSESELDRLAKLLTDVPTLKIEISGHTDNVGSQSFNQKLSENRAKSVVEYLVNKKGIAADRLTYVGYGFQQPIATNDTEEGRQQNRRTEFKIISK